MTRRRVAFVLPSLAGGGAERVMLNLAGALDRGRFEPLLVVLSATGPLSAAVPSSIDVVDLASPRLRDALGALARCLRRIRPHVAISTLGYLNLALLGLRPLLPADLRLAVREANAPELHGVRWSALTWLGYRLLYPTADRVICQHDVTAAAMVRRFRVPPEQIWAVPNPIDIDAVRRAAARPKRADGPGRRFVAAGRLTRQKGFDRLIDMMDMLDDGTETVVFGEGPDRESLEARAVDRGVNNRLRFAGYQSDLAPWLAGADAFLMPSRWEGLPNAALEALACGTPVIASTEVEGLADVTTSAPAGAVTLAQVGEPFIAAMRAVGPRAPVEPGESLLPDGYHLTTVATRFASQLAAL